MKNYRHHGKQSLLILILSLSMFLNLANAAEDSLIFPSQCQVITPEFDINLDQNTPYLILINNISAHTLWLVPLNAQLNVSASQIEQLSWSALLLTTKQLSMACIEAKRGSEQRISCARSTEVCLYDNTSLISKNTSNRWITENKSLSNTLQEIEKAGITLPTSH